MTPEVTVSSDIKCIQKLLYDPCGFSMTNLKLSAESVEYGACSFELNGQRVEHRVSKITPTKRGQFVTLWKRNKNGVTRPFDLSDQLDFVVITSKRDDKIGQFIFPRSVLADKGIMTTNGKEGKRGIRVYPPWDVVENKQAEKTQRWQTTYFVLLDRDNMTHLELTKKLYSRSTH